MAARGWLLLAALPACVPFENPRPTDTGPAPGADATPEVAAEQLRSRPEAPEDAKLGASMAALDSDGDGRSELVLGASHDGARVDREGLVWVLSGEDLGAARVVRPETEQEIRRFGVTVTAVGDVDGDGHADLAVGAVGDDHAGVGTGAVHLFWGGPRGVQPEASTVLVSTSPRQGAEYGRSVVALGDRDGDGFADLAVGDPSGDDALRGGVDLWFGGAEPGAVRLSPDSLQPDDAFGGYLASGQDLDGDGSPDLVVGSLFGDAWVFEGPAPWTAPSAAPALASPAHPGQRLLVGALVDWDADGIADLATADHGAICPGTEAGLAADCDALRIDPEDGDPVLAHAVVPWVALAAEDGVALLVGATREQRQEADQTGRAFVYAGGPHGPRPPTTELRPAPGHPTGCFGVAVTGADGWVAVSDPCLDQGRGGVHLFSGSALLP